MVFKGKNLDNPIIKKAAQSPFVYAGFFHGGGGRGGGSNIYLFGISTQHSFKTISDRCMPTYNGSIHQTIGHYI